MFLGFTVTSQCINATIDSLRVNKVLELIHLFVMKKLSIIGRSNFTLLGYLKLPFLTQTSM